MKKKTFYILIILIVVLISVIGYLATKTLNSKPKTVEKVVYKEVKSKNIDKIKKEENILFLGDSITEFYPIEEIYGDLPIVRSGLAGYETTDILDKIEEMSYKYNPTSVYLLIGTNDIRIDNSKEKQDETIENIKKITKLIRKNRSQAKIYIESIYPVNRNLTLSMVQNRHNEDIQYMNSEIEKYANENNIVYIDLYNELTDNDGNFSKDYTDDGLHPNDLGYAKISQILLRKIYNIK